MNPYIADILSQPEALRRAVRNFSAAPLSGLTERIQNGEIDRIVITGMGASFNAAYPAYIQLTDLPVPILHVNAAELVHYLGGLVGPRTLLWINSQSGRSAELLHLLERLESAPPACILTCVNDESSPLASASDICLPIHAGPETTVSTKTYTNTLAVNLLASQYLTSNDVKTLKLEMLTAADAMETYLENWQEQVSVLDKMLGDFETLILIGRGASMGAVWNGALINKEAAKFPLEGMNAADFRHGPLELVSPTFTALIFSGDDKTSELNLNLGLDIIKYGGRAFLLADKKRQEVPTIPIPGTKEMVRPIVEVLPMQLLTLVLAARKSVSAGQFRYIQKVTDLE